MSLKFNHLKSAALASTFIAASLFAGLATAASTSSTKLLTANFAPRTVVKVEVGDFHFRPGQTAPIHTHSAPAIGYITKGAILFQVEGEKPQILREGDAFFEPVGPRILRFDNLSATEEAIFIDYNFEQVGEPFIVFEEELTEDIDRRTLPTTELATKTVDHVDIYESELASGGTLTLNNDAPTLAIVAEGVIDLVISGQDVQHLTSGETFALPKANTQAIITNASSEVSAKVITFALR